MANLNDHTDYSEVPDRPSSREGIMNAMDQLIPDPSRSSETSSIPSVTPEPEINSSIESPSETSDSSHNFESSSEDPIHSQAPKEEKVELPKTPTKSFKGSTTKTVSLPKSQPSTTSIPVTNATSQFVATTEPERPFDEEIDSIKAPPGVNPAVLKTLRELSAKYKGEVKTLKPQLTQLQAKVNELTQQTGKIPDQVEHELKELRAHRTLYDIQNDPHFKAAYDDKISLTENQIYDHLRSLPKPIPESDIEEIKKGGGLLNYKTASGELLIDSQWWKNNVRDLMPFSHGAKYEDLLKSGILLKDAKEQTVQQIKQNRERYESDRAQYVQQVQQQEGQTAQKIVAGFQEKVPWARIQDVPVDATPELRLAIEEDNKFVPELEKHFAEAYKAFNERNVVKRTEIAATYALAYKQASMLATGQKTLTQQNATITQQNAEISRLNTEIQKMRNAGKTRPTTPTVTSSASKPKAAPEEEYMGMNTKQALAARLG